MRALILSMVVVGSACAGGNGATRDAGNDDGGDVADDTLGSTNVTNDTIDPTNFSTTGIDDSGSTGATTDGGSATGTTADATTGTSGSTAGGDAPTVVEVVPNEGATGIDPATAIAVTFSAAMDPTSVTVDLDTGCTGAIQVSDDGFATCIAMIGAPVASDGDTHFELQPADTLASATEYAVRVTADARSAGGVAAEPFETASGFVVRYFHTILVDGQNDWSGGETFPTSTDGHLAFTAWDADYVYLAMQSPDVEAINSQVWVVVYIGGAGGTTTGQIYNTQRPELLFDARWHLRWRADNTFTDVQEWDGMGWASAPWQLGMGDVFQSGQLVEFRIARSDIGDPDALELHMGLLSEAMLSEWSWAAHPQDSYIDGYDPDYAQYWSFDLLGSAQPIEQPPSP